MQYRLEMTTNGMTAVTIITKPARWLKIVPLTLKIKDLKSA